MVSHTPLKLSLTAVTRCWVELRLGSATGPVAFEGTMVVPGQQQFVGHGGLWLRLGNPTGVIMRVDGGVVPLPASAAPYDVTLVVP
jgi:hypothetical protein